MKKIVNFYAQLQHKHWTVAKQVYHPFALLYEMWGGRRIVFSHKKKDPNWIHLCRKDLVLVRVLINFDKFLPICFRLGTVNLPIFDI